MYIFLSPIYGHWFFLLNGFTLVIVGDFYSWLFRVSQGSVLKAVPWPIMVYFYKLLLGWRVVSLALIPHLPISIDTSVSSLLSFTKISSFELYGPAIGCNLGWIGRSDISAWSGFVTLLPLPLHQLLPPCPRVLVDFGGMTVLFPRNLRFNQK